MSKHILLTGGAGFIGSHVTESLLQTGHQVTVIDNFDDFYDKNIKVSNLKNVENHPCFRFIEADICDQEKLEQLLQDQYDAIVHLAAKAGVRPSIQQPRVYQQVNVTGTQVMLDIAYKKGIQQFVFGSSSSVYGVNPNVPWSEKDNVLQPISPYAATKIAGELLGHVYSHLYGIRFIALRFFTVFGPRQRPDLAIAKFCQLIKNGKPIPFYGDGSTRRDYTYVADIVAGIVSALEYTKSNYEIINLGNHRTVSLRELVTALETALGQAAHIEYLPEQEGDVPQTFANIDCAQQLLGYQPKTSLETGLSAYIHWLHNR
jgi:UDP-glucuronate 4-epimerase